MDRRPSGVGQVGMGCVPVVASYRFGSGMGLDGVGWEEDGVPLAEVDRFLYRLERPHVSDRSSATNAMAINFPRREKAAAKVGPRLEISPLELEAQMSNQHGLSALLCGAETWEPFAWKGNDLSAPLRVLYAAESRGLLQKRGDRPVEVAISDITADINGYLLSFGKKTTSENAVLNNLRQAALYLNAALGISIRPDRQSMTVQVVGELETVETIERYFSQVEAKLKKLGSQIKHAEAMGYSVSHVLQAAESATGMKLLTSA
jgi:hypothetical protein